MILVVFTFVSFSHYSLRVHEKAVKASFWQEKQAWFHQDD